MLQNVQNTSLRSLKTTSEIFWKFSKGLKASASTILREMFLDNSSVKGGQSICNLFSKHCKSIYCNNNQPILSKCRMNAYEHSFPLSNIVVSKYKVLRNFECIDCNKGPGPDLIPSLFLKNYAEVLYKPLSMIYKKSLQHGVFPKKWKKAHTTLIYKFGCLKDSQL